MRPPLLILNLEVPTCCLPSLWPFRSVCREGKEIRVASSFESVVTGLSYQIKLLCNKMFVDLKVPSVFPYPLVRMNEGFTDMSWFTNMYSHTHSGKFVLPDKEFRYLRTVIVTAAVHRGFGRQLPRIRVTDFLNLPALGRRQPPYVVLRLCGDLCFW